MVSGWSAPEIRSRSASTRSYCPIASFCFSTERYAAARLARARNPLLVGQGLLVLLDRVLGPPAGRVGSAEAGPGAQRGGVPDAEMMLGVGEQRLVGRDRFPQLS